MSAPEGRAELERWEIVVGRFLWWGFTAVAVGVVAFVVGAAVYGGSCDDEATDCDLGALWGVGWAVIAVPVLLAVAFVVEVVRAVRQRARRRPAARRT